MCSTGRTRRTRRLAGKSFRPHRTDSGSAHGRVPSMCAAATASPTSAPARPTPMAPSRIVGIRSRVHRGRPTATNCCSPGLHSVEPPISTLIATVVDVKTQIMTSTPLDVTGFGLHRRRARLTWLPSGRRDCAHDLAPGRRTMTCRAVATAFRPSPSMARRARSLTHRRDPDGNRLVVTGRTCTWPFAAWPLTVVGAKATIVEVATGAVVRRMDEYHPPGRVGGQ